MNTTHGQRHTTANGSHANKAHTGKAHTGKAGFVLAMCVLAFSMIGCASSAKTLIRGKVIAGLVGQSVGASPEDERFDEPGIPQAKVSILRKSGGSVARGRGIYTTTTTDALGNFELTFANGQFPRDAVMVRVEGDGIYTSRSQSFLPKEGEELMCVVITRPGYVIPEPTEEQLKKLKKK